MPQNTLITISFFLLGLIALILILQYFKSLSGKQTPQLLEVLEKLRQEINNTSFQNRQELQQKIDKIGEQLLKDKTENIQAMQKNFQQSHSIIKEVTEKLTKLDETNKQVLDFSGKLQSLENILKNPKQRGILGEYFLEALLGNVLQPGQYKLQYQFPDGETVDAAIFYQTKIIPIDAKFSLENYNRIMEEQRKEVREELEKVFRNDIKKRIEETAKYIRPKENTTEFAFMFIPAEGVFYSLLTYTVGTANSAKQNMIEYAFSKHVIIVSPVSFFAYLQTVLMGLRAQQMEENVEDILKRVGELGKHIAVYDEYMMKLGKNLGTTVGSYNQAYRELKKIDKDVVKLSDEKVGGAIEPILLEKPLEEN